MTPGFTVGKLRLVRGEDPCLRSSPQLPGPATLGRVQSGVAAGHRVVTRSSSQSAARAAARRSALDHDNRTVRVVDTFCEFGQLVKGTPKSAASMRTRDPARAGHSRAAPPPGPIHRVRSRSVRVRRLKGGQLRRSNFSKTWARAVTSAGLPVGIHFHDLRHTGNTLTAATGASLAELMNRMGHSSARAASVYLHARQERDRRIAATLDKMVRRELRQPAVTGGQVQPASGTQRARQTRSRRERASADD